MKHEHIDILREVLSRAWTQDNETPLLEDVYWLGFNATTRGDKIVLWLWNRGKRREVNLAISVEEAPSAIPKNE